MLVQSITGSETDSGSSINISKISSQLQPQLQPQSQPSLPSISINTKYSSDTKLCHLMSTLDTPLICINSSSCLNLKNNATSLQLHAPLRITTPEAKGTINTSAPGTSFALSRLSLEGLPLARFLIAQNNSKALSGTELMYRYIDCFLMI